MGVRDGECTKMAVFIHWFRFVGSWMIHSRLILSKPIHPSTCTSTNKPMPFHTHSHTLQVRSRTFSENINGEGVTLMVPFADLANHSFSHNSTFCVGQSRQNFELRSVTHIDKGEEAAITYGEFSGFL